MNKTLVSIAASALLLGAAGAAAQQGSLVMVDQQNNPVSDITYGDYAYAFLMSDGSYIGMRNDTQQLEVIGDPLNYTFRSRYSMRSLNDTGLKEDIVELPAFSVVGASGVGTASAITTGVQGDFSGQGFTKGKFSPMDYDSRTYLDNMAWFKTISLPNIGSTVRVALAGLYSTPITRAFNATANSSAFVAISHDLGSSCNSNADCYSVFGEPRFTQVQSGQFYFYPSYSVSTAWVKSMTVPAFDAWKPFSYGRKQLTVTVPATTIRLRRRTVKHPTQASLFTRSCLGMIEERREFWTSVSDSETEQVWNSGPKDPPDAYGTQGVYANCVSSGTAAATSITSPSLGGTSATRRRATTRPITDQFLFCGDNIDLLECGIFYGAPFYQASTDLRSLSYLWNGKFYLVDTVTSTPRAMIAVASGITPTKFFGYVGNN